ncbi:hypothetical protein LCGC14_0615460 [marine sediment metagenome]|uniref:Uncharacterized protein n=1 Tax=marine sediment metagenome TaxID=412755 RepID=A0A0F9TSU2_9ZZZZ|nr:hypothetical protein [bacterium]
MAKEPEENKESKVTLEELQSSIDSFSQKIDTSMSDVNTRLDEVQTKFDDFKPTETQPLAPQTDSYVPKGWAPSTDGGWNDVYAQFDKQSKETAATAASTAVNAYKDEVVQTQKEAQVQEDKINKSFDDQINTLEKEGRIPKIEKAGDEKDLGEIARKEIYQLGVDYDSSNLIKMADLRDKVKAVPPKGIDAPVGSSIGTTEVTPTIDYVKDIKNKDMDTMIQEEFPR